MTTWPKIFRGNQPRLPSKSFIRSTPGEALEWFDKSTCRQWPLGQYFTEAGGWLLATFHPLNTLPIETPPLPAL